jgi:hypothetical protein
MRGDAMMMGKTSSQQRNALSLIALSVALLAAVWSAKAHDETKYPDLRGQWTAVGGSVKWIPDKPRGLGQEAPLTPEYQRIFEDNLADMAEGGQGTDPTTWCLSPGMPRVTNGYSEIEFVITSETFHILVDHVHDNRRIFTDGRTWPTDGEPGQRVEVNIAAAPIFPAGILGPKRRACGVA